MGRRKFMRVCMGRHVFQEGLGMHGQACILGGIEKEIHDGLQGQACIPRGIEKEIHEGLHGLGNS